MMAHIGDVLNIHPKALRSVSSTRYVCIVPDVWIRSLQNFRYEEIPSSAYSSITDSELTRLLAPSTAIVTKPWERISVKTFIKRTDTVGSLVDKPLCRLDEGLTSAELHVAVSKINRRNVAFEAREKYNAAVWPEEVLEEKPILGECSAIIRKALERLFQCKVMVINQSPLGTRDGVSNENKNGNNGLNKEKKDVTVQSHPNIAQVYAILESKNAFHVIQPFVQFTLCDAVMFSPCKLNSYTKQLFLIYQILQAMRFCHSRGISVGELSLSDIFTDEKLWLRLNEPSLRNLYEDIRTEVDIERDAKNQPNVIQVLTSQSVGLMSNHKHYLNTDLPDLVQKWMHGEIGNFDYLMLLNHFAGRTGSDPNHHPVLPWVTDFTAPNGGFRDLTKSKYRLTKGDRQLDLTYNISDPEALNDPYHIPHHVSEVLSDITYYVYKARRTDKSLLCAHVRAKWVPHEYPSTMQRLQEWTPDESIPEFFTDPTIFSSIHDDLPDLELPEWCESPRDFIDKHMAILEGEYVSSRLHHWIDLTFGFKLSGTAAENAKNVCLQLVDQHTLLSNHGVVQLFDHPHPQKLIKIPSFMTLKIPQQSLRKKSKENVAVKRDERKLKTSAAPRSNAGIDDHSIQLPQGYNPLHAMEQLEALMDFSTTVAKKLPPTRGIKVAPKQDPRTSLVARDMQSLGCLMMEIFIPSKLRPISPDAKLCQRYELVRGIYENHFDDLPRPVRHPAYILLNLSKKWDKDQGDEYGSLFKYDVLSGDGLPPPSVDLLLHPAFTPIPFPRHFPGFYSLLHKLKLIEQTLAKLNAKDNVSSAEKLNQIRILAKQKVAVTAHYLNRMACHIGVEMLEILMPYIVDMFEDPLTSAQAAWSLFNPMSTGLGPVGTEHHFLSLLIKLFDNEETTSKFMKIYHRSYLMQLVVRLGMDTFLSNFSTLLIEAAAGYKNFYEEEYIDRQISKETEELQYPGVFVNEGFEEGQQQTFENPPQEGIFEDNMSLEDEDRLKAPADPEVGSSGSGSIGNTSQEDVHESHSSGTKSSNLDMEDCVDSVSIESEDVSEDMLGKSLGRLSVHSVSRFIDEDRQQQNSVSADSGEEWENLENKENGFDQAKGDEEEEASESDTSKEQIQLVVRHDTEDFTQTLMNPVGDVEYNISDVAAESIKWLAHRIGPVLTAKHLSRNLLRMLTLCYLGEEQLELVERDTIYGEELSTTKRYVVGDNHATQVLECLSCIVILYGEHVILLQYFQHVKELVSLASKRVAPRTEAGLISCLTLLIYIIPYLSDATLMDNLQDTLFKDMLLPMLKIVSSNHISFPTGWCGRSIICYKLIDVLYIISLRIGFEMTREHMTFVLQKFFAAFSRVHDKIEEDAEPKDSPKSPAHEAQGTDASKAEEQESLYFEIKRDTNTHEYKVGKPIPIDESGGASPAVGSPSKGHRRQSSLGTLKHSLSPTKNYLPEELPANQDKPLIQRELKDTFTPALAHAAYIPFCKLAGGIHMEQNLLNDDLIRQLCTAHDLALARETSPPLGSPHEPGTFPVNGKEPPKSPFEDTGEVSGSFGRNVSVEGNKIMIQDDNKSLSAPPGEQVKIRRRSGGSTVDSSKLRCPEMKMNTHRHLKGNWLAYWEHEVGMTDRDSAFNINQIKLQSFAGHTSSVRSFSCLDNENSFLSASKDKTVKLWSLRSSGDGSSKVRPQWTYANHRKSVFSVSFLESVRYVASCDSNIHIWDPFIGMSIRQWESPKNSPISVVVPMPAPNACLITASSDSVLRFLDIRKGSFCQEFKCTTLPAGLIRSVTVSPDGKWVAVGFSSGVISTLDLRTGLLIASWKAHEGEILQIKAYNNKSFVTSSFDQHMNYWNYDDVKPVCSIKGLTEPVHCFSFYKDSIISATTANRVAVHAPVGPKASFTSTKLKSDVFRGVLTTMSVLPLNRLLLLGSDNGEIRLLA